VTPAAQLETDPRRLAMRAAAAAGGASAALISFAITCDDEAELRAAADECLVPILCAAVHVIDAAGILPGEEQRAALRDIIVDYVDPPEARPGRCRICGCTEHHACTISGLAGDERPCGWADAGRTLCDNPNCLASARMEIGKQAEQSA
jgi:hypothetical protein